MGGGRICCSKTKRRTRAIWCASDCQKSNPWGSGAAAPELSIVSGGAPQGGLSCPFGAIHLLYGASEGPPQRVSSPGVSRWGNFICCVARVSLQLWLTVRNEQAKAEKTRKSGKATFSTASAKHPPDALLFRASNPSESKDQENGKYSQGILPISLVRMAGFFA